MLLNCLLTVTSALEMDEERGGEETILKHKIGEEAKRVSGGGDKFISG
jgi:hypothetical protein